MCRYELDTTGYSEEWKEVMINLFIEEWKQEDNFNMECHELVKLLPEMSAFPLIWQEASQEMLQLAELPFRWWSCPVITDMVVTQQLSSKSFTAREFCLEGTVSCTIATPRLPTSIGALIIQRTAHKNETHYFSSLRKVNISVSFWLIFCYLLSFPVNLLLSFQLIANGLGHFLLINLVLCLMGICVFQKALPRSEIISEVYISLAQILLGFFGGGGVGQRCCCMSPCWKLPPAISASRSSNLLV